MRWLTATTSTMSAGPRQLDALGARPRAQMAARRLRELGARDVPRGPRPSTRANAGGPHRPRARGGRLCSPKASPTGRSPSGSSVGEDGGPPRVRVLTNSACRAAATSAGPPPTWASIWRLSPAAEPPGLPNMGVVRSRWGGAPDGAKSLTCDGAWWRHSASPTKELDMPRYLVQRTFPDGLAFPDRRERPEGRHLWHFRVRQRLPSKVTWMHPTSSDDDRTTWCIYDAPEPRSDPPGGRHQQPACRRDPTR